MGEVLIFRRGIGKPTLKGISVKTPPAKDECLEGEAFDFTGMVISANIAYVFISIILTVFHV